MATWYFWPSLLWVWVHAQNSPNFTLLYLRATQSNRVWSPLPSPLPKLARYSSYLYSDQSPLSPFLWICLILFLIFFTYVCRLLSAVSAPCSTSTETSCEAIPLSVPNSAWKRSVIGLHELVKSCATNLCRFALIMNRLFLAIPVWNDAYCKLFECIRSIPFVELENQNTN
jgi:hypothetical protein